jgi:predicted Ser/Thr protein kinase
MGSFECRGDSQSPQGDDSAHPPQIGPYRIEAQIGEGGMGRVYRARESHPPREVALKLMRGLERTARQRFRREAELLAALEHPNIARLYAAGEADLGGLIMPWLAMEYVRGEDLLSHARQAKLDLRARLRLLIEVCRAVHFAHGRGVIHRDLKPGNILVDPQGAPRILDFGIARLAEDDTGMTQQGQVLGTVPYMSPEQLAGRTREVDTRSDVYALGVVAYELIADRLPYPRLSTSSVLEALEIVQRDAPPELASRLPAARGDLNLVVMKALASDPARRYASAAELGADLERVLDHRPVEARAPTVGYLLTRFVRRHRALSAAAGLVLVVLLVATGVSLRFALSEAEARQLADQRAAEAESVTAFLEDMLVSADPEQALGTKLSVAEVLDQASRAMPASELPDAVAARLLLVLSRAQMNLGAVARARPLLEAAAQRASKLGAAGRADLLLAEIYLANADLADGAHDAALARVRSLLEAAILAPELEVEARQVEAHALVVKGQHAVAIERLQALIALSTAELGAEHRASLTARHNLASTLQASGQLEAARQEAATTLAMRTQVLGRNHPETLHSLNLMAALNHGLGESGLAEQQMRELIGLRAEVIGAKHPSTLTTRRNLAVLLVQTGRREEALEQLLALYADAREALGVSAPQTLSLTQLLAYVYSALDRDQEAYELLRRTVDLQQAAGGPGDPSQLFARNDLGMTLLDLGRPQAAVSEFEALLAWAEPMLEPADFNLAIYRSNYAEALLQTAAWQPALEQLERAEPVFGAAGGESHPRSRQAAERRLRALQGLGREGEAAALQQRLEKAAQG